MLNPQNSIVVMLEALPISGDIAAGSSLQRVISCAEALSIPIFCASYRLDKLEKTIRAEAPSSIGYPSFPFEPEVDEWQTTVLAQAIAATGRRQLLICGRWLKEGITLLAHQAMRIGLDAYVCIDISLPLQQDHLTTLQLRLVQHNIVVTTTEQAVREWIALSPSEKRQLTLPFLKIAPERS
ncbi:MAG: hypothetical protein ABL901_13015 [Hyphomicrobiaceae bacterium]|nr:hypothetical protein [Hyphomicrobiaceae bacterium]